MSGFLDVAALDEAGRAALARLVVSLADSKRLMGIRYSDWVLGAPTIETGIAASSMCQDEWGHARLLYAMMKELGQDPVALEHDRPAEAYASLDPLDAPFPDWAAVVSGMVIVDGAIGAALAPFARGSFEPATTRGPKMLAEEEFHRSLGLAWYRRLATRASDEARERLVAASEAQLPAVLAWLGAADGAATLLVELGVTSSGEERMAAFHEACGEVLDLAGIDLAGTAPAAGWDEARGRGTGHPDADAVERARGDRNRMLFVE